MMPDGAAWLMLRLDAGMRSGVEPPIGHPSLWTWARTRTTLDLAMRGFVVKPAKEQSCPGS